MRFTTKLKLLLLGCVCILVIASFVAFNSFGIDTDTIYQAQGQMNTSVYDRARGYRYSGNEIYGLFQHIDETAEESSTEATDNTYTNYDSPTVYVEGNTNQYSNSSVPSDWLGICDSVHRTWGASGLRYHYGDMASVTYGGVTYRVRQDCSGYVGFCMYIAGYCENPTPITSGSNLSAYGYTKVNVSSESDLVAGDVLTYTGHIEVYYGRPMQVYNWGGKKSVDVKYNTATDYSQVVTYGKSGKTFNDIKTVWRRQ